MKQPSVQVRIPTAAFDVFASEAIRQVRPITTVVLGAARAFAKLSPAAREEFTIGERPSIETAASLLKRNGPAPANRRRNGGAK